ncbi:hypothetical protein Q1W73_05205 [Asticcacaulis sp. ZE23SCel15]|uniref:hypothetical protein n=1 Tax=Asticcacaulis sp. ZE23SCel15 TaxID=3059027 RepID=UPI00265F5718|nr:hypothetical protein [Asticcacaulis sp. ZE23SCel15]WKL58383.1 hypothetical protein Q1W73_05205 [Asticcacaulis sp. ZE23SCel15]
MTVAVIDNRALPLWWLLPLWVVICLNIWSLGKDAQVRVDMPETAAPDVIASTQTVPWTFFHNVFDFPLVEREEIVVPVVPGHRALRVRVTKAGHDPWNVLVHTNTVKPIRRGDRIEGRVWLRLERAPQAQGANTGRATLRLQNARSPYAAMQELHLILTPQWQEFTVAGVAPHDFKAGEANLIVYLAGQAQTVDVGPATLYNRGLPQP